MSEGRRLDFSALFYELPVVNLREAVGNRFPDFQPELPAMLAAVSEYRSEAVIASARRQLNGLGLERVRFEVPDLPSRRVYAAFWAIAVEQNRRGNGEYLRRMVGLQDGVVDRRQALGLWQGLGEARVVGHLQRMADPARSLAEQSFVLDFLAFFSDYAKLAGQPNVLADECLATVMSWTLAPYICKRLSRDFSPRRAFYLTMAWCQVNRGDTVMGLRDYYQDIFRLDLDSNHFSHEVARYCACELADRGIFERIGGVFRESGIEKVVVKQEDEDLRMERLRLAFLLSTRGGLSLLFSLIY